MQKSTFSAEYAVFLRLLREARTSAGVTQEELAERVADTQSFVSKCERGERRLDFVEVRALCEAIGISFAKFADDFDRALRR